MEPLSVVEKVEEGLTARRVFGEPIERDGSVVVLAASVRGGAGGGSGPAAQGKPGETGAGAGYGLVAKPAGAFVIRQGKVRWLPAVDVNRIILGGQLVAVSALLLARAVFQYRRAVARGRLLRRRFA